MSDLNPGIYSRPKVLKTHRGEGGCASAGLVAYVANIERVERTRFVR